MPLDVIRDRGHCHGCGCYTSQHLDDDGIAWICTSCTFENTKIHHTKEQNNGGSFKWLVCLDCGEVVR